VAWAERGGVGFAEAYLQRRRRGCRICEVCLSQIFTSCLLTIWLHEQGPGKVSGVIARRTLVATTMLHTVQGQHRDGGLEGILVAKYLVRHVGMAAKRLGRRIHHGKHGRH